MAEQVRLVFLGGLGEIGRNCAAIEHDGRVIVLDCGIMFPDQEMPGVDLVLPDFSYLRENAGRIEGIVLTHGHEDHIGGLGFLLRDIETKVFRSCKSPARWISSASVSPSRASRTPVQRGAPS